MAMSNLATRTISAVILAPIVLFIIYLGGWPFRILVTAAAIIMLWEWFTITKTAKNRILWGLLGLIYISLPCTALIWLRTGATDGTELWARSLFVYWIIIVVWSTDIGAYFAGKTIGGPKLAPKISPKKTWAGLIGGMMTAAIIMFCIMLVIGDIRQTAFVTPISAVLAIVAQMGDLFESWVKRKFGVKDSGNIIPGHGGLLDRLDGLLFVVSAFALFGLFFRYFG